MQKISDTRAKRAKLNIVVSLGCQIIVLICGLVIPRSMIGSFGSEAYGATASISQFLAYITLLEGGIGGVARAALYKPLAENNILVISEIIGEIKRFFRIVGYIFAVYVLILACGFQKISNVECFDWFSTFALVIVISISTFAQYFVGISYSVLLQAAQRTYITSIINIATTILNTLLILLLIAVGSNLIIVKLVSSCVFVLRPVLMWMYVRKSYRLTKCDGKGKNYLSQKWDGLGQHVAYFLYSNTDIAVLTVLVDLRTVAVYSVYYMVVSQIENFTTSFSTGMEALFGDMLAKNEIKILHRTFGYYETLLSMITTVLFSVTAVLIIPFVKLYTSGITDTDYIAPLFSVLLIAASAVSCLRKPYHNIIIAAGHFRQTQIAAYGEAVINIILSVLLVIRFGLIGVAIGTLTATLFRMIYYADYLTKNIFNRKISLFIRRESVNIVICIAIYALGSLIRASWNFSGYIMWALCGAIVTAMAIVITVVGNAVFYKDDLRQIMARGIRK